MKTRIWIQNKPNVIGFHERGDNTNIEGWNVKSDTLRLSVSACVQSQTKFKYSIWFFTKQGEKERVLNSLSFPPTSKDNISEIALKLYR